jgi:hypothetical protein
MLSSILSLSLLSLTLASPIDLLSRQLITCKNYTIINTRGTSEPQGPSVGFLTMNSNVLAAKPGGRVYNTIYPADFTQQSQAGTADILRELTAELAADPARCFILEGYSQGAAATVRALERLPETDARFKAVKGVFLIGNPDHKAGLSCNVDMEGGDSTKNVNGISSLTEGPIPTRWVSKSLDVCNYVSVVILQDGCSSDTLGGWRVRYHSRFRYQPTSLGVSQ